MGLQALRRQFDPAGHLAGLSDPDFARYVAETGGNVAGAQPQDTVAQVESFAPFQSAAAGSTVPQAPGTNRFRDMAKGLGQLGVAVVSQPIGDVQAMGRAALQPFYHAGRAALAIPQGIPAMMAAAQPTQAERADTRRAAAATLGILAGTGAARLAGQVAAPLGEGLASALAGAAAGSVGGAADTAIRTAGDPRSTALAAILGAPVGATLGGLLARMGPEVTGNLRAANPLSSPEARLAALDVEGNFPTTSLPAQPFRPPPSIGNLPSSPGPVPPPAPPPRLAGAMTVRGRSGALVSAEPGDLFHGTNAQDLSPASLRGSAGDPFALYGPGVYLTDNPEVAAGYARARSLEGYRGPQVIYRARLGDIATLDMEKPAPKPVIEAYETMARRLGEDTPDFSAVVNKPGVTPEQMHRALVSDIKATAGPLATASDYLDTFAGLTDDLRRAGYEALAHTGGKRTGGPLHRVTILMDPADEGQIGRRPTIQSFEPVPVGTPLSRTPIYEQPTDPYSRLRAILANEPPRPPRPVAQYPPDHPASLGMGPGRTLSLMNREAELRAAVEAAPVQEALKKAGLEKLNDSEKANLYLILNGVDVPPSTAGRAADVYAAFRAGTGHLPEAARAAGLSTGEIADYYPRQPVPVAKLTGGKARVQVAENLQRDMPGRLPFAQTPAEAQALVDDYVTFVRSKGEQGGQRIVDAYNRATGAGQATLPGQGPTEPIGLDQLRAMARPARNPRYSAADFERAGGALSEMFHDPDPAHVLPAYVHGMNKRIAEAQIFGPQGETEAAQLNRFPAESWKQKLAAEQMAVARGAADMPDPGAVGEIARLMRRGGATLMSPLTSARNLTQGGTMTPLVTSPISTLQAYGDLLGSIRRAKVSGAVSQEAMGRYASALGGDVPLTGEYLKWIGMGPTEVVNRASSSGAAVRYAQGIVKKMLATPPGMKRQFYEGELNRLMVRPQDIGPGGVLTEMGKNRAAYSATRQSQFTMAPGVLPEVMSKGEGGKTLTQFKSFPFQAGRTIWRETADRLRSPNPYDRMRGLRNLAILGTAFPALGEASRRARAAIAGKKLPKTSITDALAQDIQEVGGIGIAGDITSALQYEPSDYAVGPSITTAGMTLKDLVAANRGQELSVGEKRRLLRTFLPGIGPLIQNRVYPPGTKNPRVARKK